VTLPLLSDHPGKRATERFWLLYTPVWGAIAGVVMLGGFADHWGDVPLMILGVGLAIGAVVGPFWVRPSESRKLPWHQSAAFKCVLSVVLLSFGLNYTQTPFFFDVLHMHYGFNATWTIDRNPIFLYFMTVPYFATYFVLCTMTFRGVRRWLQDSPRPVLYAGMAAAPFAVAFLETLLNANPFLEGLFCYDDMALMYTFGTFAYGTAFCLILPVWMTIDESAGKSMPWHYVGAFTLAALYADLILIDIYRYGLAPYVTTVIDNAPGLRDFGANCLGPLPPG